MIEASRRDKIEAAFYRAAIDLLRIRHPALAALPADEIDRHMIVAEDETGIRISVDGTSASFTEGRG